MAFTKEIVIGRISVEGEYKLIHVRTDTVVKEDGVELSRSHHRHVLHPDVSDEKLAEQDSEVQAVANAVFTQAIKDAWEARPRMDI